MKLTAEARRRGESGDRVICTSSPITYLAPAVTRSPDHRITPSGVLTRAWDNIVVVLKEIFDESAYERYLAQTHGARSVQSYRDFLRERESTVAQRPRCC